MIPAATVRRLPRYLSFLERTGKDTVSSQEISKGTGVPATKIRKDLSYLGTNGTPGLGYDTDGLRSLISLALGLDRDRRVAIVGAGNLGSALAGYRGFSDNGFDVVAIYDISATRIGQQVGQLAVRSVEDLASDLSTLDVEIVAVTTPIDAAQWVADKAVTAGVRAVLNFAPVALDLPPHVVVQQVDVATELRILAYYLASEGTVERRT